MEMGGKLFIASPSFLSSFCGEYVTSLVATIKDCQQHGIKTAYQVIGDQHWIDIARDILADMFLASDCTHMLQIDADLGWAPDAPRRMLERDVAVIGGVYPIKSDLLQAYPYNHSDLPGGFLMVKREVIEGLSQGLPKYKCAALPWGELQVAPLFTREMREDGYTGEDYMFCRRVRKAGFAVMLEANIDFQHVGRKVWRGNYEEAVLLPSRG